MSRRRKRTRTPKKTAVLPSTPLSLPTSRLELLTKGQIEQIHHASLQILEQTGIVVNEETAVSTLKQAGAKVRGNHIWLDADLVMNAVALAPASYTLHARNPANSVTVGGDQCVVMPGGGPPFVRDLDNVRRAGTLADVANFAKLSQMSPSVHVMARKAVEAQDLPAATRHLDCWHTMLTLTDKPIQSGFVNGRSEAEDALQMLAITFGGESGIDGTPVAHCSVNANSPLLYDKPMLEGLIEFAKRGQPVLISPFVMSGVTGPTSVAGTIALQNAEVLAGIALAQLIRAGTPVLYGAASSNVDMRNANPAIGSPESAQSIAISAQLARFYNLPCRGGGALTDSPIPDAQSNYERMMTLYTSLLSGVNYLMQGLGILESYLTISYAQFVIDLELLEGLRHIFAPIEVNEESLALEAIAQAGPGGHFLDVAHTLRTYRDAHFMPSISIREPFEQWEAAGEKTAVHRATQKCRQLLEAYEQPALSGETAVALQQFITKRKKQINEL